MADKLTLLELHLHSDDNEFTSDVQLSSDIGELLSDRLGLGLGLGSDDSETDDSSTDDDLSFDTDTDDDTSFDTETETDSSFESEPDAGVDPLGADGGAGAAQTTDDEETDSTVVEIDEDVTDDTEESSGSTLRRLFVLGLLVGLALAARWYLDGDDLDDEFAVGDDEFGIDDDDDEFEEL